MVEVGIREWFYGLELDEHPTLKEEVSILFQEALEKQQVEEEEAFWEWEMEQEA